MMISASSNVISQEPRPPTGQQAALEDFQQLAQDLKSGNLSGAQSIYSTLAQNAPSAATDPNTPLGQAFQKLGQALQSGDMAGAAEALQSMPRMHGRHFHAVPLTNASESASAAPESGGDAEASSGGLNITA